MKQYQKLLKLVLKKGSLHANRTGVDAISYFGTQTRYDLTKGFHYWLLKRLHTKQSSMNYYDFYKAVLILNI